MVEGSQTRGLGHLSQYMHKYNAEIPKQDRKRFNSIVKTIHNSYLPIIYLCLKVYRQSNRWTYCLMHTVVRRRTIVRFANLENGYIVVDQLFTVFRSSMPDNCLVFPCTVRVHYAWRTQVLNINIFLSNFQSFLLHQRTFANTIIICFCFCFNLRVE